MIYYRDRRGRRRPLRATTLLRKARRLPPGTYVAVYRAVVKDEVAFGATISPQWHPLINPYIIEIPWDITHDEAVYTLRIIEELVEAEG